MMLAQLGARLRSLLRGDQYWEQGPVTEVGAIQMMRRVRARWEVLHNALPDPRRFDLRAVVFAEDRARAARAAPPPLADADWNVPLPLEWVDARGNATRLDDAFFAQREYRLESLTGFLDAVFVSIAYRCVLKRAPDRTGFHGYLTRLRTGEFDRIDVLRSLVRSSEAEVIGVRIARLRALDFWRRVQHVRVVGPFIAWANAFVRLSRLVRRQQLIEAQAAAWHRDNRDETRQIIGATAGPIVASLAALELARSQIEDGLTAVADVLERLDVESRHRVDDAEAHAIRLDDRLDRLHDASELGRERIEWIEKRLQPSIASATEKPTSLDDESIALLCAEVEARLRGGSPDGGAHVERRLAWVREAGLEAPDAPILDLGCGRGDWLAALREHGFASRGVDASRALVDACRRRGLAAECADPARWLSTAPASRFGVVSALHLFETMSLVTLVELLRDIRRTLVADGLLIVETTGPTGSASTDTFGDTRPIRPAQPVPLTPVVLEYLLASQGFERIRIAHDFSAARPDSVGYAICARTPARTNQPTIRSS